VVELRGFEPLTPCMPCHPHLFTSPFAALPGTTSALLKQVARQGAVMRREAACGIAADKLLTGQGEFRSGFMGWREPRNKASMSLARRKLATTW
jgi:hypothetical protein